jgi:hypothetical protein
MTGGHIQLVAYGIQDIFLTMNPQITFFKVVYRRHSNFSIETIPQYFIHKPNFGSKSTAVISRIGDLINNIYIVINLPDIPNFLNTSGDLDQLTKFSWIKNIGYALIKYVEIEIGGQLIDRQYGEWLYIWNNLTRPKNINIDNMIGNNKQLSDYSNGKNEYKLYIPLNFWFCKHNGLALPMVSLQYMEVKINVEFAFFENCYKITPTNYIILINDIVNFVPGEYIVQNLTDGQIVAEFNYFDIISKKLYFRRISRTKFKSITNNDITTGDELINLLDSLSNQQYLINGLTSLFTAMPQINSTEISHSFSNVLNNIALKNCFLLVNYIFIDEEERHRFYKAKHEYLIDQVTQIVKTVEGVNRNIILSFNHPSKFLVWVAQQNFLMDTNNNDLFNYTNSFMVDSSGNPVGKNLINKATILLNGNDRISFRDSAYFNWIQPYQTFIRAPDEGINTYSFSINPTDLQPSGTCNMSKIDNILLQLQMNPVINFNNISSVKIYSVSYNILRITNGLAGLVFVN